MRFQTFPLFLISRDRLFLTCLPFIDVRYHISLFLLGISSPLQLSFESNFPRVGVVESCPRAPDNLDGRACSLRLSEKA